MSKLEILAPAGSMEALEAAVRCGADAVYLGQKNFSARKNSQNFDEESLHEAVAYAHRCGTKIHQALNILVFDHELDDLKNCIRTACEAGVDALIVQDWGVAAAVKKYCPSMPLHASTQMAIHSPAGVRLAEELGFSRIVLARELTEEEIRLIVRSTRLETEIFVHGAHCMSISGQCYMSAAIGGKSGNRGQCAQPCRLPFSAGCPARKQAGEQVLSLKDMSLVERLSDIERMGVTSVKIEGRMKRPEYVAAAVTACRTALDGGRPDTDTLKAVFSRSGFTSGYFDGRRTADMFGARTKADVQAGEEVFSGLRQLYHKQTSLVPVDVTFTAEAGVPASLTLSDGEHRVSVSGDIPDIAENRPATADSVKQNLTKFGGTPYHLRDFCADLADGLMIRASSLNAMRREACTLLDSARESISRPFLDAALPELPVRSLPAKQETWAQFRSLSGLTAASAALADRIILPAEELDRTEQLPCEKEKILPALPRFTFSEEKIPDLLARLKGKGYTSVYCDSIAHLALCKEAGMTPAGGMFLNLANSRALAEAEKLGLASAVVTPEGKLGWLTRLRSGLPLGIFAYGRLTLMAVRNCPVKAQIGCKACGGNGFLTDRTKTVFPVRCDGTVSYIYNSLPTSMTDKKDALRAFDFALLSFTTETPVEAEQVLRAWQSGEPVDGPATRGLYNRGV